MSQLWDKHSSSRRSRYQLYGLPMRTKEGTFNVHISLQLVPPSLQIPPLPLDSAVDSNFYNDRRTRVWIMGISRRDQIFQRSIQPKGPIVSLWPICIHDVVIEWSVAMRFSCFINFLENWEIVEALGAVDGNLGIIYSGAISGNFLANVNVFYSIDVILALHILWFLNTSWVNKLITESRLHWNTYFSHFTEVVGISLNFNDERRDRICEHRNFYPQLYNYMISLCF